MVAKSKKDQIRSEILALERRGVVQAEAIHEWAKGHAKSAIHKSLEWNDDKAGYLYRLSQIRSMITLYITDESGEPELVSLSIDRATPGGGYRSLKEVKEVPEMRAVLLEDVLVALERLASRYADIKELAGVWREVAKARVAYDQRQVPPVRKPRGGDEVRPSA